MDDQSKITIKVDPDLKDLIPGFLENRHKDIQAITEALKKNDFETPKVLGHRMKGSGGGYGFDAITDIGAEIEQKAQVSDRGGIAAAVEKLDAYLQRVEVVYE